MDEATRVAVHELLVDLLEEHEALFFDAQDLDTLEPNDMGLRIIDLIRRTSQPDPAPPLRVSRLLRWIKK